MKKSALLINVLTPGSQSPRISRMELKTEVGCGADIHEEIQEKNAPEKSALSTGRRDSNILRITIKL